MDELWLSAPCPALRMHGSAHELRWRVNHEALDWGARHHVSDDDWQGLAQRQSREAAAQVESVGPQHAVLRCRRVAMPDGWLVWLRDEERSGHGVLSIPMAEQLTLAQRLGRLGLWERDLRTGMGRWDHTMFALLGFDPAGPVPSFDAALAHVHPEDRERLAAHHRGLSSSGSPVGAIQYRVRRPDGSVRHLESIAEVRRTADGVAALAIGVQIDVTDTVERMQAQQHRVEFLDRALDLSDIAVWRVDFAADRVQFNPRGYRMLGLPPAPDGLRTADARSTLHPDDRAAFERSTREATEGERVVDCIARFRIAGDQYRTMLTRRVADREPGGRVLGLVGVGLDITDLETERARATTLRERLVHLSEALGLGLWTRDVQTQRMEWDAQMFRLYRRAPEAGSPTMQEFFDEHVHPLDAPALQELQLRADREWIPEVNTEFRIQTPDGVRWIAAWTRREIHGGRKTAFGAHLDITERHHAAAAKLEKERLEQATRAQAEFVTRVGHELRTPLQAVLGFGELLADDREDPLSPAQRERLRPLLSAATHLRALLDDTLDLTRAEAEHRPLQFEPVALGEVGAEALEMARPLAERHAVTLRPLPQGRPDRVLADRRRLTQVVTNLLTNAIKYNRPQGWVEVDFRSRSREGLDEIALVVRDCGHGMTPEQIDTLFEPFNRLGAERRGIEGTGIGLTIVRQFTERMGGSVAVASQPGQGSEFAIWLPAAADAPARRSITALCIEDNEINQLLMREMFSMRPEIELLCESTGEAGIATALLRRPDLILLDLHLPDVHGLQVLARLRAEPALAPTRIIALSANAMPADVRAALAAGFDDYWTKPIDFTRFAAGIDAIVAALRASGR